MKVERIVCDGCEADITAAPEIVNVLVERVRNEAAVPRRRGRKPRLADPVKAELCGACAPEIVARATAAR